MTRGHERTIMLRMLQIIRTITMAMQKQQSGGAVAHQSIVNGHELAQDDPPLVTGKKRLNYKLYHTNFSFGQTDNTDQWKLPF